MERQSVTYNRSTLCQQCGISQPISEVMGGAYYILAGCGHVEPIAPSITPPYEGSL